MSRSSLRKDTLEAQAEALERSANPRAKEHGCLRAMMAPGIRTIIQTYRGLIERSETDCSPMTEIKEELLVDPALFLLGTMIGYLLRCVLQSDGL